MKLITLTALLLVSIGTCDGMVRSLWCYKCQGDDCNTPVDSTKDNVFITECDKGICYTQETMVDDEIIVTTRGCYQRRSDCVPGCRGTPEHENCETCCEQNLCNGAGDTNFNLFALIIPSLLTIFLMRE